MIHAKNVWVITLSCRQHQGWRLFFKPTNITDLPHIFESCENTASMQRLCSHVCVTTEQQLRARSGLVIHVHKSVTSLHQCAFSKFSSHIEYEKRVISNDLSHLQTFGVLSSRCYRHLMAFCAFSILPDSYLSGEGFVLLLDLELGCLQAQRFPCLHLLDAAIA